MAEKTSRETDRVGERVSKRESGRRGRAVVGTSGEGDGESRLMPRAWDVCGRGRWMSDEV